MLQPLRHAIGKLEKLQEVVESKHSTAPTMMIELGHFLKFDLQVTIEQLKQLEMEMATSANVTTKELTQIKNANII